MSMMYCTVQYNAERNGMEWKNEQWNMIDTGYYKRVLERLEQRCVVE